MNRNRYRLVFNATLGMQVPAAETARSRGKAASGLSRTLSGVVFAGVILAAPVCAADLPGNALPDGAVVKYGDIGIAQSGNTLNINQATQNGIIHWNSFNIGSQATVNFNQPAVTAATLNRITGNEASVIQGALNAPGAVYVINRNGILFDKGAQVNLHTLVASTLDIKDDELFRNGFLSLDGREAAFSDQYNSTGELDLSRLAGTVKVADGAYVASRQDGRIILMAPDVTNEGSTETKGGQIILAAGKKAYFHTPDGSDSLLRGLVVVVEGGGTARNLGTLAAGAGGDVTLIGALVKQDGAATASTTVNVNGTIHLLAQQINPDKTAAIVNNRPAANETGAVVFGTGSHTAIMPALDEGKVSAAIAAGKLDRQQVEDYYRGKADPAAFYALMSDETIQDAQAFSQSRIFAQGKSVWVQENASLVTPSGEITLFARNDSDNPNPYLIDQSSSQSFLKQYNGAEGLCLDCRLQVDEGARLDVSGLRNVSIDMERNVVEVELRGNELRDTPLLHGEENAYYEAMYGDPANPLYGKKIKVDIRDSVTVDVNGQPVTRQGTALADASGYIAQIGRRIDEKSTTGGTVNLYSEGGVVVRKDAKIDFSGGSLQYRNGEITTSQLIYKGRLYDIATAAPDKLYQGLGPDRTVYEQGYVEGRDAGTLRVVAPVAALQGTLSGTTVAGIHQRGGTGDPLPRGGQLILGFDQTVDAGFDQDYRLMSKVSFGTSGEDAPDFATSLWVELSDEQKAALGREIDLNQAMREIVLDPIQLREGGISRLSVYSNNAIELASGQILDLGPGGSLSLTGAQVDIDGRVNAAGGEVSLKSTYGVYNSASALVGMPMQAYDQHVSINGSISTAGLWSNDYLDRLLRSNYQPVVLNGGSISVNAGGGSLSLGQDSLLEASAGAWLQGDGKTIAGGRGGNISLKQGVGNDANNRPSLNLAGRIQSYGVLNSAGKAGSGGDLTVQTAENVRIGGAQPAAPGELHLDEDFFTQGGFAGYTVKISAGNLMVAENTRLAPRALTRIVSSAGITQRSAADMAGFSQARLLERDRVAKAERPATDLTLSAANNLSVGQQASIALDSQAALQLSAGNIDINGDLSAPGGSLTLRAGEAGGFYAPNVSIWLGSGARLSVAGIARTYQANGLIQGGVLDGGSISLLTGGYLMVEAGALLDASGSVGTIDLPMEANGSIVYARTALPSAGGMIRLAAAEGLFVQEGAVLQAKGGSEKAEAGTLRVELDRPVLSDEITIASYPVDPVSGELYAHRLLVSEDASAAVPTYLSAPGASLQGPDNASGVLSASHLKDFDNLDIKAGNRIVFDGTLSIASRGRLTLDAPNFVLNDAATVSLAGMYVNLGNGDPVAQDRTEAATGGNGVLEVNAGLIDLTGNFTLQGVKETRLNSSGDIRLVGVVDTNADKTLTPRGQFSSAGDMAFKSAQVYASSLSEYVLKSVKPDGLISFAGWTYDNGDPYVPLLPLTGGSSLSVQADLIEQAGVLRAPIGHIALEAGKTLTLADGSLTSVSAEGQAIPFGRIQNGRSWVYDFTTPQGTIVSRTIYSGDEGIVDLPAKAIELKGDSVDVKAAAKVDVSGGGDLVGHEFAPGPGGSSDYLAAPGVFAIMPASNPAFAPSDFQANHYSYASASSGLVQSGASQSVQPGDSIYLSAIPELGIAAGYYTLLPSRYALLPGAYAVRAVANTTDMAARDNVRRQDGSYLASGYTTSLGDADTGVHRWSGFEVAGRDVVATNKDFSFNIPAAQLEAQTLTGRSEIVDYRASQLLPAINQTYDLALPKMAQDAGRLSIEASSDLKMNGQIDFSKPEGGLGGELDIASRKIAVTDGSAPHVADAGEYLLLDVDLLASYGVDSLMIGGTRKAIAGDASRVKVNQVAETVLVETTADKPLVAAEVMLVSRGSVTLAEGSEVRGEGGGGLKNETLVFGDETAGESGDGVLLRASSGALRGVERRNVSLAGDADAGLYTASDALVYGEKSVNLDATYTAFNLGRVNLGANGALQLGATRVALGQVDQVLEGVFVTNELLDSLGNPEELVLKSYSNFDIYGDADLGSADTRSLTLQGAGFADITTGNFSITAQNVIFANPDGRPFAAPGAGGSGSMTVHADNIGFGPGLVETTGFDTVDLVARGEITGLEGSGGLKASGDLGMTAQRIVGYQGSDMNFAADGKLTTANYVAADGETLPVLGRAPMGARMTFSGGQGIEHGGNIDMPAGWLSMTAESGDVSLLAGSKIFTGGVVRQFHGANDYVNVYVAGGQTALDARTGDVNIASGATVDVSGRDVLTSGQSIDPVYDGKGGADAGALVVYANGVFKLDGELKGDIVLPDTGLSTLTQDEIARRPNGGVLVVDADSLPGGVSNLLSQSSGFGNEFSLRQRTGDLTVAAGDTIAAERVNLSADAGVLDIAGKIDAQASAGGWVMAAAGKELYLRDGAEIDARATGANQHGGEVYLLSGMNADHVASDVNAGALVLENGSSIDVSGTLAYDDRTTQSSGGRVHLQAPRLASGEDVRITQSYGVYDDNGGQGAIGTAIGGAAEVEAIGNRVFEFTTVGSSQMSTIKTDSQNYMNTAATALSRLGGSIPDSALKVRAGEEVRSSGDLIFSSSDYDFDTTTNGIDEPGTLTLRAAGNLLINGNLSDGFDKATVSATAGYKLDSGDSWSYRLVAGSDLSAADPMAVRRNADPATGDFVLKGGKLIRTGTGAIQVAAAGDIEVGLNYSGAYGVSSREGASYNTASVIYTAGRADTTDGFAKPNDISFKAVYPVDGGSLSLAAGGSIRAPEVPELMNQWLVRRGYETDGNITTALTWGIDFRYFDQGVGALGGGNVRVRAGENIENLSVSLPTTGRDYATEAIGTDILETGGGNLSVVANGDIRSAVFYVQRGEGSVVSGNSIGAMPEDDDKNLLLALGDSRFQVNARTDLALESAFNPTVVPLGTKVSSLLGTPKKSSYFFSYGEDSGVDLVSAQGDIVLNNKMTLDDFYSDVLSGVSTTYGQQDGKMFLVYPGSLTASSVNGDVQVARSFWLYPSSGGELHLLADGDVTFGGGEEFANVVMSDQSSSALSSLTNPVATYAIGPDDGTVKSSSVPVHADDPDPVRIYAENGDIKAVSGGTGLVLPKSVELLAGRDIVNTSVIAQNLNADQTSIIRAGRDVRYTSPRNNSGLLTSNGEGIRIGGDGYLEVAAGRNIDLGTTGGIVSSGNLDNPNLAYGGADIVLLAGMGTQVDPDGRMRVRLPDYDTFLSEYGDEAKTGFHASLLDYERLRQALLDDDNAALSYKQVLDRLEDPGYRQAMTQKAMPDYEQAVAVFDGMLASDVGSRRDQAARRLYYSALQQASSEVSMMKQLASLGFDLSDLNKADQPGMVDAFSATLANSGLPVSSLEGFARFFEHAAVLVGSNRPSDPSYDVLESLGYQGRADKAIEALLPANDYAGDYNGFYSQVRTEQGSDIDILVPGGSNTIGLVNAEKVDLSVDSSGNVISRADSTFGLYTTNGGSIRSYSQGDFLVNTSRVFTLGWEATLDRTPEQYLQRDDIFLYSVEGDVDAGKGAKTASSAPPPTFVTDDKGFTKSDIGKSISGSGIGVLLVRDVINRGDTYLIAPNGEVNAGDAGIRASGNLFIDANRVVGADNIVAVGVSIGVPTAVDTSGLSVSGIGSLGDAAQAANQATGSLASSSEEAQKASAAMKQALANFKPSSVSVEVLGFGDGSTARACENDSAECNRQ